MTNLSVPQDTLSRNLAQYLREKRRTNFSPYTNLQSSPPPAKGSREHRKQIKSNPFHPDRFKASALTVEVSRLYSAIAFAMWQYGVVMNVHLTICWRLLGITHHEKAAEVLSRYNHEAAKWLKVGIGDNVERRRVSRRASDTSASHFFVYAHENARDRGFHTHQLMYLPVTKAQAFAEWSRDCLSRLSNQSKLDEAAVFFSPASEKLKQFKPYEGARESFAVQRQWNWFQYIAKSLDPNHMERAHDGGLRSAREIFRITKPFVATPPVTCRKLAGYSENIGRSMQRRVGFSSKFDGGDWANLYNGSELNEYRTALAEEERRLRDMAEQAAMKAILAGISI